MKTAAAYIRVSTGDQLEYSPDSQLKAIREYAQRRELVLSEAHIYVDEGISGRTAEKRPAFMRMIAAAKSPERPFEVILLWKFSRFARNREDSIVYKSMLRRQCGVEVISVSEQLGEDKTSILIEALLEAMDEYYSINLGQEVTRGMAEKAERGGVISTPPFGFFVRDNIFVPDPASAPAVQMAFRDFLNGLSPGQIATKLNALSLPTRRGNHWQGRTVRYMLGNPAYIGLLRWTPGNTGKQILARGRHEPLVEESLFKAVQKKLRRTQASQRPYSRPAEPASHMLKGLVVCSECRHALVMSARGRSLQCSGYAKGKCAHSHYVLIERLETAVLACIRQDLGGETFIVDSSVQLENIAPEAALLTQEKKRLERITAAFESGADTLEEYQAKKSACLQRLGQLESAGISTHYAISRPQEYDLYDFLENSQVTAQEKNQLLRAFIRQVIYDKDNERVEVHYFF